VTTPRGMREKGKRMATQTKTAPKGRIILAPREKFARARKEASAALIEREAEIDLVLTALLCGEHPLLVGPPGTGKSFLLDAISRWCNVPHFDYLMTKYTDPMELFGPVDLPALKAGECKRVVSGFLPEAHFAFLDEIFKSSSAILNCLLKVMNERRFKYGMQDIACPLRMLVAASNEYPAAEGDGKELGALFDRFLFRRTVRPIASRAGRDRLLGLPVSGKAPPDRNLAPKFSQHISPEEIDAAGAEARKTPFSPDAADGFRQILDALRKDGVTVSDRRLYKSVNAAQAFAYLNGAREVEAEHLEILAAVLWDAPGEAENKAAATVARIANPTGMKIAELEIEAAAVLDKEGAGAHEILTKLEGVIKRLKALPDHPRKAAALEEAGEAYADKLREVSPGFHSGENTTSHF
jgi:MoxR-like ATPase